MISPNRRAGGGSNYYLFAGRLEQIKGIELVLKAFSFLRNVEIHLAGSGKEQYEAAYSRFKNIRFMGQLDREEMLKEYGCAKALVVASQTYEGFSINIIEAFACGIPVIVGNMGNSGNLVQENTTGIHYQYNSAMALVRAIKRFEEMDDKNMRENALSCYRDNYSADVNYQRMMEIYLGIER